MLLDRRVSKVFVDPMSIDTIDTRPIWRGHRFLFVRAWTKGLSDSHTSHVRRRLLPAQTTFLLGHLR